MSSPIDEQRLSRIRADWRERAKSSLGRFFIASQPDWQDPSGWGAQADVDFAALTHALEPEWLANARVLEIGCGVGRLAHRMAPRCRAYTGIDLCPEYLAEARRDYDPRLPSRFLQNDGVNLPAELQAEEFEFIYAFAVFIHCPKDIIESYVERAAKHLAPNGILRFQVLADINDPEGVQPPESDAPMTEAANDLPATDNFAAERAHYDATWRLLEEARLVHLVTGTDYQGHIYTMREAREHLAALAPGLSLRVLRLGAQFIGAEFKRD